MSYDQDHALETFKSLISISMEGLKTLLLINGGAVVAIVAFLGQSTLGSSLAPHFWWPIAYFVSGLALCTVAFIGSYFTQYALYNEHFPKREYKGPRHQTCLWATLFLVLLSVLCFGLGAFKSISVIATQFDIASPHITSTSASRPIPSTINAPSEAAKVHKAP